MEGHTNIEVNILLGETQALTGHTYTTDKLYLQENECESVPTEFKTFWWGRWGWWTLILAYRSFERGTDAIGPAESNAAHLNTRVLAGLMLRIQLQVF